MASFLRNGRKIVAIGRNYANHIKELGNTAPKEPFFFLKPTTSYVGSGGQVEIPKGIIVHHEVELGVIIGKTGRDITPANAESFIAGYTLAIDMTARNLQDVVKKAGLPWSAVKGFDTFTPISHFIPKEDVGDPHNLQLWLKINGATKQDSSTADMIFRIPRLIEHVSSIMTLEEGDVLLTGTPAGVGPISAGDEIAAGLKSPNGSSLAELSLKAIDRKGGYSFSG
ncbi:hypothetical protein FRB96_004590 [Tulasnella sp. 330]|nr:hypothetical protein FRB96_004590 [Tulasnella sp. 330]KAG8877379.1 hypothetical protein FRB97_003452 [Tulasnella sp. 331]